MNSVMESLWYGNISPHDTIVENNFYYKRLLKLMGQNRDRLLETLTSEMQTVLKAYDDNINEMNSIAELEAFRYGVQFGVHLMAEARESLKAFSS